MDIKTSHDFSLFASASYYGYILPISDKQLQIFHKYSSNNVNLLICFRISLERYFHRTSSFCCIKIHIEMTEISQVKTLNFYIFIGAPNIMTIFHS